MEQIFTLELLFKLSAAFVASIAFAILLRVNKRHLLLAGTGAAMTYLVYVIANTLVHSLFAAAFISTLCTALYAEILARVRRAPTIVYTLTGVIPTVPGGDLYHAMRHLITGNVDGALVSFKATIEIGLGIAGGIVAMSIIFGIFMDTVAAVKKRRSEGARL